MRAMSEHFFLSEAIAHFITWACGDEIVRARERRASFRAEHAIRLRGALRRAIRTSRAERATECEELCDDPSELRERSEQQNASSFATSHPNFASGASNRTYFIKFYGYLSDLPP